MLTIKNNFSGVTWTDDRRQTDVPKPYKYLPTRNLDNSFKIIKQASQNEWTNFVNFKVRFEGLFITASSSNTPSVIFKVVRKSDTTTVLTQSFDLIGSNVDCILEIEDVFFQANQIEFFIYAQFNQPTVWNNCAYEVFFRYYDGKTGIFSSKVYATYHYKIPLTIIQ